MGDCLSCICDDEYRPHYARYAIARLPSNIRSTDCLCPEEATRTRLIIKIKSLDNTLSNNNSRPTGRLISKDDGKFSRVAVMGEIHR